MMSGRAVAQKTRSLFPKHRTPQVRIGPEVRFSRQLPRQSPPKNFLNDRKMLCGTLRLGSGGPGASAITPP